MNNIVSVFAFVAMAFVLSVSAEEEKRPFNPGKDRPTTPEEVAQHKAWVEKRRYQHFGGDLLKEGSMKGEICIVNCQTAASDDMLNASIAYLRKETRFNIQLKKGSFSLQKPVLQGDFSLFVVDQADVPTMLLAPESKWAVLNVAGLKEGRGANPAFFKARVLKEMSRTFAGLCGAISSNYPDSLTTGIFTLEQLDRQEDQRLSVDVIGRLAMSMQQAGVTPAEYVPYRKACREGWAPSPTNDVQKAIWDEIHAIPDKPIKITKQK